MYVEGAKVQHQYEPSPEGEWELGEHGWRSGLLISVRDGTTAAVAFHPQRTYGRDPLPLGNTQ